MNTWRRLLTAVLVGGAMALNATVSYAESTMETIAKTGKMTIAVQTQGPPVSFVDKNGERTGLAVEIARLMAEDMGVELVIQDYDWKGLIPALLSGKADFIAADMTPTAKRSMQIIFTEPVFFAENIAFALKSKDYKAWEDLNDPDISVGATQASSYADAARKFLSKATLKEYAGGTPQTVQAVVAGRVDAGISDRATIASQVKANDTLMVLDGSITLEPLGFAVRPDSLHLLHALNNYMRLIRHDGRLDALLDYWWKSSDWEADHK
ncbi:MAG: transporter substrate-binding domain-containing protein [Rhizobiales bacterium]|nr:transporter substrate-binding domain-containing protein [Hyphomicrobiales bacterium]